jgi:outer membrane protein assembly factor BamB
LLDVEKGTLLWEYDAGEQITACPAVIEGRFYILTAKGTLFCFGEKGGAKTKNCLHRTRDVHLHLAGNVSTFTNFAGYSFRYIFPKR